MTATVAWRILTHEMGRSALAIGGAFVAVILIFMQLGFYYSVPTGGMTLFNAMRFDIMLASPDYTFQIRSQTIPRRRLYQASSLMEVALAAPLYQGAANWRNPERNITRRIFIMAFKPVHAVFDVPDIVRQVDVLSRPDTLLVDSANKTELGSQVAGSQVEANGRNVWIGGRYKLGVGFVGLGAAVTSDQNFLRIFPRRKLSEAALGLVILKPGADPDRVAEKLRRLLPRDTRVFTRKELSDHEAAHWVSATSTGLVFGTGVIIAFVVGLVILFQTLSTQIIRNLPEYATLKSIGYRNGYIALIVLFQAVIMALFAFGPALALSLYAYDATREATGLPVIMTGQRVVGVFLLTVAMCAGSALLALRAVRRADPVDLF